MTATFSAPAATPGCLALLPPLRRARGYHLYDGRGRRWLDLYQEGGKALLGHRPKGVSTRVKNALSCGLSAAYPSIYQQRVVKALSSLVPECAEWRLYSSRAQAEEALGERLSLADPLKNAEGNCSLWRPFVGALPGAEILSPLLPLPGTSLIILGFCGKQRNLPPSEYISAPLLAGLIKVIALLKEALGQAPFPVWSLFDEWEMFQRVGPYLLSRETPKEYERRFSESLAFGVLLSPEPGTPSVIPGELSPGDRKRLAHLFGRK